MDIFTTAEPPRATILHFPRKRGRPRNPKPMHDSGTPELAMKRARQETSEALDLCLARELITPEQHWCGIHLRWLYTLRYGAPGVRALDPTHMGGREIKLDDPDWRESREAEYAEAVQALNQQRLGSVLLGLCVHNERPPFLTISATSRKAADANLRTLNHIREGLDMLSKLWRR